MMKLTKLDKEILNLLQGNLQLEPRPFQLIGKQLGLSEEQVISRLQQLKAGGYIRKIGAFFNSDKLGYQGTLVALRVKPELMEETAIFINQFPGITHNERLRQDILTQIRQLPGVEDAMDLSARRKYKINVQFNLR